MTCLGSHFFGLFDFLVFVFWGRYALRHAKFEHNALKIMSGDLGPRDMSIFVKHVFLSEVALGDNHS